MITWNEIQEIKINEFFSSLGLMVRSLVFLCLRFTINVIKVLLQSKIQKM